MAEKRRTQSESQLQGILRTVVDGVITTDVDGVIRTFNPAAELLFGYSSEEIVTQNINLLIVEPRGFDPGTPSGFDVSRPGNGVNKDGTRFPIEVTYCQTTVLGATTITCITRKALGESSMAEVLSLEAALRESDHLYRLRFEQSSVAQVAWADNFHVASWNPAAERLFGYSAEEAIGRHGRFIVPEHYWEHTEAVWLDLITGRSVESTNENTTKDGRTIMCEWHNAPITSADGRALGVWSEVLNVTERTQLQNALLQSQKMEALGQLAGGVAHDLNNIMAVIVGYGSLIRDALPSGNPQRDDVIEVLAAADRASALTRQLLTFSRQQPVKKTVIDLNQSLAGIEGLLRGSLLDNIDLKVTPSKAPAMVQIDTVQFDQILLNLAVNARDAMPDGGKLTIALSSGPLRSDEVDVDWVYLEVSDTGSGIDEDTLANVFEPFFTTKVDGHGTGLGLAICYGVVTEAGGQIDVRSTLGVGTTFTIKLPICDKVASPSEPESPAVGPRSGAVVLVAEDDAALRKVSARIFKSAGYEVHVAADGVEAKQKIDELGVRLNLLFCDVVMPGFNGFEVSTHAATVNPETAVLLTSGFIDEAARLSDRGDAIILWKPVAPRALIAAAAAALGKARTLGVES